MTHVLRRGLLAAALGLAVGCGGAKPVDPKPPGAPDTRLRPVDLREGGFKPSPSSSDK